LIWRKALDGFLALERCAGGRKYFNLDGSVFEQLDFPPLSWDGHSMLMDSRK
jgi:hypothetical protein